MQKSLIINPNIIILLNGKVNNTLHIYVYETHKADPDEQYESGLTVSTAHLSSVSGSLLDFIMCNGYK